jgi:hypothetical protein
VLQADVATGQGQRLVGGHRLVGQALGRPADDRDEPGGVALQQGDPAPVFQAPEQLGEVHVFPGDDERALVGDVKLCLIFGQQCVPDRRWGRAGKQQVTDAGLLIERP